MLHSNGFDKRAWKNRGLPAQHQCSQVDGHQAQRAKLSPGLRAQLRWRHHQEQLRRHQRKAKFWIQVRNSPVDAVLISAGSISADQVKKKSPGLKLDCVTIKNNFAIIKERQSFGFRYFVLFFNTCLPG